MSRRRIPLLLFAAGALLLAGISGPAAPGATAPERPPFDTSEWKTDFGKHSVPLSEIMSGGPPKDGIRAIDRPEFVGVDAADGWLKPREPVIFFVRGSDARAYPLQILIWHEIVNDIVGALPVAITFCPLCNTAPRSAPSTDGACRDRVSWGGGCCISIFYLGESPGRERHRGHA